jgi:regulatory protein
MNSTDELSKAKQIALTYLARRALTGAQLGERLEKKGFAPEICDETVKYFTEMGYINDFDYAERFIKDSIAQKQHGIIRIKAQLRQKGVETEIINNVISSLKIDNLQTLRELAEKKCQGVDLSDLKQKNRLVGYFVRRGYRYDEINKVLRERDEAYFD